MTEVFIVHIDNGETSEIWACSTLGEAEEWLRSFADVYLDGGLDYIPADQRLVGELARHNERVRLYRCKVNGVAGDELIPFATPAQAA